MQAASGGRSFMKTIRSVLDACADCDTCRFLMDESCLLFPELYRLYDQEKEQGRPVSEDDLRRLSELCTLCGLCPCPDIPMDVIRGKTERVQKKGLPLRIRLLADVQRFGRLAGLAPKFINKLLSIEPFAHVIKRCLGIHPHRRLTRVAEESFFAWSMKNGLTRDLDHSHKIAYFAGCTAGYLFPEVARAAVNVLKENGLGVYVPPQQCCGMPTLVEGDFSTTFERLTYNLSSLLKCLHKGYDLVCSCPTCGFLMKILLKEGAYYSRPYQQSINASEEEIMVPDKKSADGFVRLKNSIYPNLLRDNGYFTDIDPLQRIALSDNVSDLGAYLEKLRSDNRLNLQFGRIESRVAYFAPCHQREQGIGSPYIKLLELIPGLTVMPVGGAMDCCGMGGSLGFKREFYESSLKLAQPLMHKIQAASPLAIITDCLSCRLQFEHNLPFPVLHPLELISQAYVKGSEEEKGK
jgi:glycerol-3-phosphate dehydrogenase subunit C